MKNITLNISGSAGDIEELIGEAKNFENKIRSIFANCSVTVLLDIFTPKTDENTQTIIL